MSIPCRGRPSWGARIHLLAGLATLFSTVAQAQSLTLGQALGRALERSPELASLDPLRRAQDGARMQAGARAPLEMGLLIENAAGSGAYSGFDAAESTLSLGVLVERGARQRRIDVAEAQGTLLDSEARNLRLDVAAETARRFIVVLEHQQELANAQQATQLAQELLGAVRTRVAAARAPLAEEARALAHLARARLDEEHAAHELATSRFRLASQWNAVQPDFETAEGNLFDVNSLPTLETFRTRLERNPELERLASEKRVREAEIRLAETRSRPSWQLTAGVRRFEDTGDHALVVGINVPLASRDLARGAVGEARARSGLTDSRSAAVRARLNADLFALYQELLHAHTEVGTLRTEVLPKIEEALEQSRYAYERGRYGYVEWVAAQRELLDVRLALVDALSRLHQFRIEMERLTGTALGAGIEP
jgi:cobalt-zinc-cadmium efflux system outer membrane protein